MYRRRIISCLPVFVIILSLFSSPVYATVGDGTNYIIDQFWSMIHRDWDGVDVAPTAIVNVLKEFLRSSITPETATDEDWKNAYDDYVDAVKTHTGTATLINGGVRIYFNPTVIGESGSGSLSSSVLGVPFSAIYKSNGYSGGVYVTFDLVSLPFDCTYTKGYSYSGKNVNVEVNKGPEGSDVKGRRVQWYSFSCTGQDPYSLSTAYGTAWIDCIPYTGVVGDYYDIDISNSTRPTVIIGDVGYYDASNNLQVLNNTTIVNETNNTFFNPVTNTTTNVTNWAYDYSTRTYTLALEGGLTVTVGYGNDNITINEGGTTYSVYYVYSNDNPGGGGDTDSSGFFAWWKEQWLDFRTWLAGVLPGGDSTTVPDGALPNLPGETEGDSGFSILDIIKKIVSALWKLVSGFFGTIFGGVFQFFVSLGDNIDGFFSVFDSDDGVFGFGKYGGADIWD